MNKEKEIEGNTTVHIRPICDCCGYVFSSSDNLHVEYMRELLIMPFCCPACKKRISSIEAEGELFRQLVNESKKYNNDNN